MVLVDSSWSHLVDSVAFLAQWVCESGLDQQGFVTGKKIAVIMFYELFSFGFMIMFLNDRWSLQDFCVCVCVSQADFVETKFLMS